MFACKLWTSTKIVRGMNWVEIATAGCRTTGTSRSGIASDMLVVEGLGSIRRPKVVIDEIINKLEIKQINLSIPTLISRIWNLQKEIKIKTVSLAEQFNNLSSHYYSRLRKFHSP
ncbi:hypothetical protein ACH3XW_50350 [Acanthocheilonema viteae]